MKCDHYAGLLGLDRCTNTPDRAPRVAVPARGAGSEHVPPLRMFTTMHFCEWHKGEAKIDDLLSARVKRDFEEAAARKWPLGVRPDFDRAGVELVLTSTPEYRRFTAALGQGGIMRLAIGAARLVG